MSQERMFVATLDFVFFLKLFFLSGVTLGALVAPFYAYKYLIAGEIVSLLAALVLIPLANGLFVAIYGVFGYVVYRYLASKKMFGMHLIVRV